MKEDVLTILHGGKFIHPDTDSETEHICAPGIRHWRLVPWGDGKRVQIRCPACWETFTLDPDEHGVDQDTGVVDQPVECETPGCGWCAEVRLWHAFMVNGGSE